MDYLITKSKYCNGCVCPKRLWLMQNKPDEAKQLSEHDQWTIDRGYEVEELAQQYFPGGVLIDRDKFTTQQCLAKTKQLIQQDTPVIYQAAFESDGVLVYSDILVRQDDGSYHLYEVKSFSDIKKKVTTAPDNFYINDLLVQTFVISENGVNLSRSCIMYLNESYLLDDEIDVNKLFAFYQLDYATRHELISVPGKITRLIQIMNLQQEYAREMGAYCNKPHKCGYSRYCLSLLPEDAIRKTSFVHFSLRDKFIAEGNTTVSTINLDDPRISAENMRSIEAELDHEQKIQKEELREFLDSLVFPLYFFDFETLSPPIPRYSGYKPYKKIPFQYSLHIMRDKDSDLEHHEFLWRQDSDPSEELAKSLIQNLDSEGSIIVYHKSFEAGVLKELAGRQSQYSKKILALVDRLADLEEVFSKRMVCLPGSKGYTSIKKILPLVDPSMTYAELDIQSGDIAMVKYWQLIHSDDQPQSDQIAKELLSYCKQDTLAMVRIYQWLLARVS